MNSQQIEIMAKKLKAIANDKRLKILYHIIDDEELLLAHYAQEQL